MNKYKGDKMEIPNLKPFDDNNKVTLKDKLKFTFKYLATLFK